MMSHQAPPPCSPAVLAAALPAAGRPADAPAQGVVSYPAAFFASYAPANAYDMVTRLPAFTLDLGGTARGLSDSAGNVLVDGGRPVSKGDRLDELLKRIPANAVARIDVVQGAASGIDMGGRTIVADVVRKYAAGVTGALTGVLYATQDDRQLGGVRVEAQWRRPNGSLIEFSQVYAKGPSYSYGDGPRTRFDGAGKQVFRSQVRSHTEGLHAFTTGAYETSLGAGTLRLNGAYLSSPATVGLSEIYRTTAGREEERDKLGNKQVEFGARYTAKLSEKLTIESVFFQQWNDGETLANFVDPGLTRDFDLNQNTTESAAKGYLRYHASERLSLEAGGELAYNRLDSQTQLSFNGRPIELPAANVTVAEKRGEAFVRVTGRVSPRLMVELDVRREGSRIEAQGDVQLQKTLWYTKPRIYLTWTATPNLQLRARLEREVGQLNFKDFVASSTVASTGVVMAGNPDLEPQEAWVAEGALEQRLGRQGAILVTLRHSEIANVVDRLPVRSPSGTVLADAPGNIGRGIRDEVTVDATTSLEAVKIPRAQLKAQLSLRRTRVKDPMTGREREISAIAPVEWEVHFKQSLPAWQATWGVDVTGGSRLRYFGLTQIETEKTSPFVTLYAEYTLLPRLTVRIEAQGLNQSRIERILEDYAGERDHMPLLSTDVRNLRYGGDLYIRVRQGF